MQAKSAEAAVQKLDRVDTGSTEYGSHSNYFRPYVRRSYSKAVFNHPKKLSDVKGLNITTHDIFKPDLGGFASKPQPAYQLKRTPGAYGTALPCDNARLDGEALKCSVISRLKVGSGVAVE